MINNYNYSLSFNTHCNPHSPTNTYRAATPLLPPTLFSAYNSIINILQPELPIG